MEAAGVPSKGTRNKLAGELPLGRRSLQPATSASFLSVLRPTAMRASPKTHDLAQIEIQREQYIIDL